MDTGHAYQIGLPPLLIDVLTRITGVEFEAAWRDRHGNDQKLSEALTAFRRRADPISGPVAWRGSEP